MSALVIEEPIGDGYVQVRFNGSVFLVLHEERGFLNPTPLCKRTGQQVSRYNELGRKRDLELVLKQYSSEVCLKVGKDKKQNPLIAGWYFHPTLLLDLAEWISPKAFAAVAIIIGKIFSCAERRKSKLSTLLGCGELPTCNPLDTDPPKWRIRFTHLKCTVDARGRFDADNFCDTFDRTLCKFEKRSDPGLLIDYLRNKGLYDGPNYHPLLFLRLAAWVMPAHFVKYVRVVFCCGEERLQSLFYQAIVAAGTPCTIESDTLPMETEKLQSAASKPATSGGQPSLPKFDWNKVTLHEEKDTDVESGNDDIDDSTMTRKEHELKMARLRRQLEEQMEHERRKTVSVQGRLEKVQEEKQAAEERERRKEAELDELLQKMEQMEIDAEYARMKLRKRPTKSTEEVSVAELKNLVLYVCADGSVVAYRRKFQTIVPTIFKDLNKIVAFVGWFITDNATLQLDRTKELVKKRAEDLGHAFKTITATTVKVNDKVGGKFDLPDAMCNTLRMDLKVMEADVRILGRLFHKRTYKDNQPFEPGSDRKKLAYLAQVHRWMEDEHVNYKRLMEKRRQN